MKPTRRTLCYAALALALSLPTLAAEKTAPARKRPPAAQATKRQAINDAATKEIQYADQPGQALYQVMLAEIAVQRGDPLLASSVYADLAMRTRDPLAMERAVEIAGYARRFDLALEIAKLWIDVEPTSKRAQQILTGAMVVSNQLDDLAPNLIRTL